MNLKEIQQPSDKKLFEAIDQNNNTGYLTEDLVSVVRSEKNGQWSQQMDAEDLIKLMEKWDHGEK